MPSRPAWVAGGIGRGHGRWIARSKRTRPRAARMRKSTALTRLPRARRTSAFATWPAATSRRRTSESRRLPRSSELPTRAASAPSRQSIDAGVAAEGQPARVVEVEDVVVVLEDVEEAVVEVVEVEVVEDVVVVVVEGGGTVVVVPAPCGMALTSVESALAPPASTPPV